MSIKEIYEWAKLNGIENDELVARDPFTCHPEFCTFKAFNIENVFEPLCKGYIYVHGDFDYEQLEDLGYYNDDTKEIEVDD